MRTIYLNKDFECSAVERADTVQKIETNYFDGKCKAYIEGYRFVPAGQEWTRRDGVTFKGEMVAPYKDSQTLEMIQTLYEEQQATEAQAVYTAMMTDTLLEV